ncbi:MAG: MiaB/RimO family radical SAM methylthiotransferase [Spirochaetales bacterium]
MKYHLVPLGCQMNQSDTERIKAVLEGLGYENTDEEERADILGVVACSVRQKAIDKVYGRIHKWTEWKAQRPLLTFVSGCILPADREKFVDRFDLLFTINELPQLPTMLRDNGLVTPATLRAAEVEAGRDESDREASAERGDTTGPGSDVPPLIAELRIPQSKAGGSGTRLTIVSNEATRDKKRGYWKIPASYSSGFEAFVPIQNGCDKFCTFCAVPYTRGREVSRPSSEILAEVEQLVERGYKSITLLGQNVNSYGLDRSSEREGAELTFAELLKEIGEIGERTGRRFWTYFTSPHPRDMRDDVIDVIRAYRVIAKQIHLPIQSGDDKVLIRMNRNHKVSQYRRVVEKIRDTIPEASIFTDIIVGFTGETSQQFEETRSAMREFAYNMAYIAMYSPRPGAASARWDDDVPHDEKRRRLHELSAELQVTSLAYNEGLLGKELSVLVDGSDRKEGYLSGKTEGKLIVRFSSHDKSLIGKFVRVSIASVTPMSMEGSFIDIEPDTLEESAGLSEENHAACRSALARMLERRIGEHGAHEHTAASGSTWA